MTTKSKDVRYSTLKLAHDGYKNSANALAARLAQLESGGDDARVKELLAEVGNLRRLIDSQNRQLSEAAHVLAHDKPDLVDLRFYKRKYEELKSNEYEILRILGHDNCNCREDYDE